MERLFQPLPPSLRKTPTLDNGKEFAEHEQLATANNVNATHDVAK